MPHLRLILVALGLGWFLGGCRPGAPSGQPVPRVPPTPEEPVRSGPLALHIAYPREARRERTEEGWWIETDPTAPVQSRDSTFLFGTTGRGDATLTINGMPVPVYRTGGWIAWVPLPPDTVARFQLVAAAGADTVNATLVVRLQYRFEPPPRSAWADTTSLFPRGSLWVRPAEAVRFAVRAAPGARVRLLLPGGDTLPFVPEIGQADLVPKDLPLGSNATGASEPPGWRFVATRSGPLGPDPGDVLEPLPTASVPDSQWPRLEVVAEADTARLPWHVRVGLVDPVRPRVVYVDDDPEGSGRTDSTLAGRAAPYATYHWFFPTGTLARVSGRLNDQIRLQLSSRSAAWVDAKDVHPLPPGYPAPGGTTGGWLRLQSGPGAVTLSVPLPNRVPFRVDEEDRVLRLTLYGVAADLDVVRYGPEDSLVHRVWFGQPAEDELEIQVELNRPVFGYRAQWVGSELKLVIRRPPLVERRHALRGRRIAVDAGHPPLGAVGPTGVREADVTLGVARKVEQLLARAGATVIMVRRDDAPMDLAARVALAERADAEVLVSIHANALPDGVNPFVSHGTSVYYFQPRSVDLARWLDRALVRQFGSRDLGIGRADFALVRPTWMPAALCEGLFLMMPDQEAVLASEAGQWRYARGIVEGISRFFEELAR
jgi:N-acetylmuramoyl-L-alanine amidase